MNLLEAKHILRKNGYRLVEDFASDAEDYLAKRNRTSKISNIVKKYSRSYDSGKGKIELADDLYLTIDYNKVRLEDDRRYLKTWEYDSENPETLLDVLPSVEKVASKYMVREIDVDDDDVDLDDVISEIKAKIGTIKGELEKLVKERKRFNRLDAIHDRVHDDEWSAWHKAMDSWDKENPLKVGSKVEISNSRNSYSGKITGETTNKDTGEEYWVITRDDNGKKVKINKDSDKASYEIGRDKSSWSKAMKI